MRLVDRRPANLGGAQWHNAVLPWQFEAAQVEPPVRPEGLGPQPSAAHFFGPDHRDAFTVNDSPVVRADMVALGRRLRERACNAGVELLDESEITSVDVDSDGRMRAIEIDRDRDRGGGALRLEAELFVDASGRQGVLRESSPALRPWCPEVSAEELCSAGDHDVRIDDADGAGRFLDRHGAQPGETVTVLGPDGGWSTHAVTVSADLVTATVLVGCVASGPSRTAPHQMAQVRTDLPWLGDVISGGFGVIPLRRPFARFASGGLALVGDAACQVFPAHGSGIGLGLIAGTLLAETVADADDCGDESTLWSYQSRYQQRYGGTLAAFDAFRRMTTVLGTDGVARMVHAGLLNEELTRSGLDQRWQVPGLADTLRSFQRLARVSSVAATMVPWLARAAALHKIGPQYPDQVDLAALARWDGRVRRLLGALPTP